MLCSGLFLCVPLSSFTSVQNDVISKLCTCGLSLAVYLSLCNLLPVERSIDVDFVNSTPFYLQVVYLYLAMLALRPKYYFVWTFGESLMQRPPLRVQEFKMSACLNNELHPLEESSCWPSQ